MHKHICLKELVNGSVSAFDFERTSEELDSLISFKMFLTVAGLEELTIKVPTVYTHTHTHMRLQLAYSLLLVVYIVIHSSLTLIATHL